MSEFRPCFSYHLGRCSGACIGEELPEAYNARVEATFDERRILAWPFEGPLVIKERRKEEGGSEEKLSHASREQVGASSGGRWRVEKKRSGGVEERRSSWRGLEEIFLVDNWVLVGALTRTGSKLAPFVATTHRFDYDTYKILHAFVHAPPKGLKFRMVPPKEWGRLIRMAERPASVLQRLMLA